MRVVGALCALLAASAATTPAAVGEQPKKTAAGAGAAVLAYIVSQHSPVLTKSEKTAVSQDFNGAPLEKKASRHTVTAKSVGCRARTPSLGKASPRCTLDFGEDKLVEFHGKDGYRLFDALGKVGVDDDAGMGHVERLLSNLSCTVDDAQAQGTPSTGDNVAGFACSFEP